MTSRARFEAILASIAVALSACGRTSAASRVSPDPIPSNSPTLASIRGAPSKLPNDCCSDATCDRVAFTKHGGVCLGDPRITGPLPAGAISTARSK